MKAAFPLVAAMFVLATACAEQDPARYAYRKYAATYEVSELLNEPTVSNELEALLGNSLDHLQTNLNVAGSIDVVGGALAVSGNAPHRGTEEEAAVCYHPATNTVEAAILSAGRVIVFARTPTYANLTLCINDWITQANSGHTDRLRQPVNVTVVQGPAPPIPGKQARENKR